MSLSFCLWNAQKDSIQLYHSSLTVKVFRIMRKKASFANRLTDIKENHKFQKDGKVGEKKLCSSEALGHRHRHRRHRRRRHHRNHIVVIANPPPPPSSSQIRPLHHRRRLRRI
ncbi:hypothetical protein ACS0TY_018104 [Phlomoides rotata]